jgi:hypothetical protein
MDPHGSDGPPPEAAPNRFDAALIHLETPEGPLRQVYPRLGLPPHPGVLGVGIPASRVLERPPDLRTRVVKSGGATGVTRSSVQSTHVIQRVTIGSSAAWFQGLVGVRLRNWAACFARSGDSGALAMTESGLLPIGLVMAGSERARLAFVCLIGPYLASHNLSPWRG